MCNHHVCIIIFTQKLMWIICYQDVHVLHITISIYQGCRHRGGFGGWSPPRFSALHYSLFGTIVDLNQIMTFISLKPPIFEFFTTKFVRNSPQKCNFMTFSITGQKCSRASRAMIIKPPHIINRVYAHAVVIQSVA